MIAMRNIQIALSGFALHLASHLGQISRSYSLNSGAIHFTRPKNLTQIGFYPRSPSLDAAHQFTLHPRSPSLDAAHQFTLLSL